jgi:phosphate starvation-inducible protein PhoH
MPEDDEIIVPIQPQVRKSFHLKDLKNLAPLTDNQAIAFEEWDRGQNLIMDGYAGTGKTFAGMFLALQTILDPDTPQKRIIIARTPVQSFEVGFLKGTEEEKVAPFEAPYRAICAELFPWKNSYDSLKELGMISFEPMIAIRGVTMDDAVVIGDEIQNMDSGHLETLITRAGRNTRMIFCGDDCQNDLGKTSGIKQFLSIARRMRSMSIVEFEINDIVRSGLVREYLLAKYSGSY